MKKYQEPVDKDSEMSLEYYLEAAERNLHATSRTAKGIIDLSASIDKESAMEDGLDEQTISERATTNFRDSIRTLFENRDRTFENPSQLREFIETIATQINDGITKKGVLIRSHDSEKYPYTLVQNLEKEMEQFYAELHKRISDPTDDSIATAAWIEYRINFSDHFFADGCGKASKAISSWVLMRNGKPLPDYNDGDDAPLNFFKKRRDGNPEADAQQLEEWTTHYRTLFHAERGIENNS